MKLYIIGNGFDLYHNMQTSFADFRAFTERNARDMFNDIDRYVPIDENWADLESALADLDVDYIIEDLGSFATSYSAEDWSDSGHHDFQFEVDRVVQHLSSDLLSYFEDWISQVPIPDPNEVRRLTTINPKATFLTFNYTQTLANLYGVPATRTLHIHGSTTNPNQKIILGHAWNLADRKSLNDRTNIENIDTRLMEANGIIDRFFSATFKPSKQLINENRSFFDSLDGVSDVVVLGHSISDTDAEYYRELLAVPSIHIATWTIACRPRDNCNDKVQRVVNLGVSKSKVKLTDWSSI